MSIRKMINKVVTKFAIPVNQTQIEFFVEELRNNKPFSFSRFGDGEWSAIFSKQGQNCDGHEYFPELCEKLRQALISPASYMYGMQNHALRTMGLSITRFLRQHKIKINWHNSDVFHYANSDARLFPLIDTLRSKRVVIIGPQYLRKLDSVIFPFFDFIEIPTKNCFCATASVNKRIKEISSVTSGVVFAFSASMAANAMIHELYPLIGKENWLIDFGSIWDVYAGVKSRSVYSKFDWTDIIKKNLGVKSDTRT